MSHSYGTVYSLEGEPQGYFVYYGTSDMCWSYLYESQDAVWATWVDGKGFPDMPWVECTCGQPPQECYLYKEYGSSSHWKATWCPTCRALLSKTYIEDVYEWAETNDENRKHGPMCRKPCCRVWPREGRPPNATDIAGK